MEVQIVLCLCVLLHCQKLTSSFTGTILYSTYNAIMEFDIDTGNVTVLVEQSHYVYAMDYDYKNRFIYFPRYNSDDIVRFAYPSKNRTLQRVIQSLPYPSGIAVDSTNDHIYWVAEYAESLLRCNMDGSNEIVLSTPSYPFVIRLDLTNRWMYIVERNIGILKSRFDLTEKETIANFVSSTVYCMDIDTAEQRLYWIRHDNGDMKSATFNGSDVKTILSTNSANNTYAIGVLGSNVFYADNKQLLMVAKTPGSTPTVLYNDTSRIDSIYVFNQSGM
ncbi:low-density lipoprotein receptor-related protein 4-like isoform X2 [Mytilus trossulus]|uniref:low-density lipoprotein receptor-related protein 4-like isoform X2 n=1 Tax=Mytilus trossulus TaxID=6551 RepID=UPI0030055AD7